MSCSILQLLTHSLNPLSFVACDLVRLSRARFPVSPRTGCREPLPAQTARAVSGAHGETTPGQDSTLLVLVILARRFWWRGALVNVQPDTFLRWHRKGFRLLWRWKSRPVGRLRIPKDLPRFIQEMAAENPTWGEQRIGS